MRRITMWQMVGLAISAGAAFTSGCTGTFCEEYPEACGTGGGGQGGSSSTTSSGGAGPGTGGNGQGGEGGGIPVDCDPLALAAGTVVPATCGLFVDAASTAVAESGTQAAPYKTLAAALGAARCQPDHLRLHQPLDEAALIEADARLYGGLDCATWATGSAAARTAWTAPAGEIPLAVRGAGVSATVAGFAVTSRDAVGFDGASRQGRSSIAAWVEEASVELARVDLVAGMRAPRRRWSQPKRRGTGTAERRGSVRRQCGRRLRNGRRRVEGVRMSDGNTSGGKGGDGATEQGSPGLTGGPNLGAGTAGVGEPLGAVGWACTSNGNAGTGGFGNSGTPGTPGTGGTSLGTLAFSLTGLFHLNAPGGDGTPGGRGQGGGGGGGRRGDGQNGCAANVTGPSGGSGGAGGCGGLGAEGGGAGGSSIALVSLSADAHDERVTLTASAGGTGGAGGNGQLPGGGRERRKRWGRPGLQWRRRRRRQRRLRRRRPRRRLSGRRLRRHRAGGEPRRRHRRRGRRSRRRSRHRRHRGRRGSRGREPGVPGGVSATLRRAAHRGAGSPTRR
jgi:hypothetical protein